jgi:hypothetical protein
MRRFVVWTVLALAVPAVIGPRDAALDDWDDRLASLDADDPPAYFDLAEEVADAAADDDDRALARHLFGLAGALDPDGYGRSACLALADITSDPEEKRRLLALSRLLDQRLGEVARPEGTSPPIEPAAALALAEAFSYYRRGQGPRSLTMLEQGPGGALLTRFADRIGGEARFRENARRYRAGEPPVKSDAEIGDMLMLEAALLAGDDASWAGDLFLYDGRTLVEVDPTRLAETLGADSERPLYRDGRWVQRESPTDSSERLD